MELFLKFSNILKETKGSAIVSFKFFIKYFETFLDEDYAYAMNEAKEEALHTIIAFVKAPDMFQYGLLDMPAVVQLEKDAKYALAYQLLKIFLTGRLDDYLNFQEANSELLKTNGLLHEDCIVKMILLTLVDLGMTETGQIPYSIIKDTLKIDDIEVELGVGKAISAKLLVCKIDQMNQVIIVSQCIECVFGPNQWQLLRANLATWRGNISGVIGTLHANKIIEDSAQTMQALAIR